MFEYKRFKDGGCAYEILGWATLTLSSLQVAMQGLIHTRLPFEISVIMWMWTMPVCTNYVIFATKINLSRLIELCHHKYLPSN